MMNGQKVDNMLLLDTCTLLWLVGQQKSLSKHAKKLISKYNNALFISVISAFEIGVKQQKGLLTLPMAAEQWLKQATEAHGIISLSIDLKIAIRSTQLPHLHRDPTDRIIIATAVTHDLTILTPDGHISAYHDTKTVW
jgi:PIN domain nuclease of toxin-antitoxin system